MSLPSKINIIKKVYQLYSPEVNSSSGPIGASVSYLLKLEDNYSSRFKAYEHRQGRVVCELLGQKVSCGLFGIGGDFLEQYQSLDKRFIKNQASTFFFEASGSSMSPLIVPGDILIVDRSLEVTSNKIIVAHLNGEMICKRIYKNKIETILNSDNKNNKPIHITNEMNLIIFGVVTGIAREFYQS